MILPPKIEIYTQLVCRSIPADRSGTTLPAPLGDFPDLALPPPALPPRHSHANQSILLHFQPTSTVFPTALDKVEDDTWARQCRRSPAVQKGVASLVSNHRNKLSEIGLTMLQATSLTLVMGVLSVITTGYWGSLSDRWGRRTIIALALAGTIFLDAVFLMLVLLPLTEESTPDDVQ